MADDFTKAMLQQAGLETYIQVFEERHITRDSIGQIIPETLHNFIPNEEDQVKFKTQWRTTFNFEFDQPIVVQVIDPPPAFSRCVLQAGLYEKLSKENFIKWIKSDAEGESILIGSETTKKLQGAQSGKIVSIIVNHMIRESDCWMNEHLRRAAEILAGEDGIFPGEAVATYYVVDGKKVKGKIPNKYRNLKNAKKRHEKTVKERNEVEKVIEKKRPEIENESKKIRDDIQWVKDNETPTEEMDEKWKNTSKFRYKGIKANKDKTTDVIFKEWTAYNNTERAAKLIELDFSENFKAVEDAIAGFDNFFETLRGGHFQKKDAHIQKLENLLKSNISADHRLLIQVMLLSYYYPPHSQVYSKANSENDSTSAEPAEKIKKTCKRFSTLDCIESIFVFVEVAADLQNIRDAITKKHQMKSIQPYVICIGASVEYATQYWVVINNLLLSAKSAADALDVCFKTFHVFDSDYPKASEHLWELIETGLYELRGRNTTTISHIAKPLKEIQTSNRRKNIGK